MNMTHEVEALRRPVLNITEENMSNLQGRMRQAPGYADVARPGSILTPTDDLAAIIISEQELLRLQEIGLDPECVQPERLVGAVHQALAERSRHRPISMPLEPVEVVPMQKLGGGGRGGRAALIVARHQGFAYERKISKRAIFQSIKEFYGGSTLETAKTRRIEAVWIKDHYSGVKLAESRNHAARKLLEYMADEITYNPSLLANVIKFGVMLPEASAQVR